MDLNSTQTLLAMAPTASPPGSAPNPTAQTANFVLMMVVMVVMFYFVLIRPQQKKAKEHAALLKNVKPGDRILTSSGIVGVVLTVKEKTLTLRSADTKLEITKAAIAEITERSGEASES
jgi:preprotein translocase subunit YajC